MQLGYFAMPAHPPERDLRLGFEWDLEVMRWLDELGFQEAWVGEHHNVPWEPLSAPDLLLAQAFRETENIRLGPGGFILPFHHPVSLANRLSWLDHISGGRLNFGVATGSVPADWSAFNVDGRSGVTRRMSKESLEIILKVWNEPPPWRYEGEFWTVELPEEVWGIFRPHIRPVQRPHPPIGMAGISPGSDTLRQCGERGFIPMSLNLAPRFLTSHWQAVEDGAASAGRTAHRKDWRIVREVLVAETDAEAMRLAKEGCLGRMTREYNLPFLKNLGALDIMKSDPAMSDADITLDYLAQNSWIVGSPDTVTEKLAALHQAVGGFGVVMVLGFDYLDQAGAWRTSLELLAREVAPRIADLG